MKSTLTTFDPFAELRAMDAFFDRLWSANRISASAQNTMLPIGIFEKDGNVLVRASVPGIAPEDIEISIENNVLSIRGEFKEDQALSEAKVYRREYSEGTFSRSVRLPEKLDFERIEAEFSNGFVTVKIPMPVEPVNKPIRVPLRTAQAAALESGTGKGAKKEN